MTRLPYCAWPCKLFFASCQEIVASCQDAWPQYLSLPCSLPTEYQPGRYPSMAYKKALHPWEQINVVLQARTVAMEAQLLIEDAADKAAKWQSKDAVLAAALVSIEGLRSCFEG
jgi:hypothetical protein